MTIPAAAERPNIISEEDWDDLVTSTGDMSYGDRNAIRLLVSKIALAAFNSQERVPVGVVEHEYEGASLTPAQKTALLSAHETSKESDTPFPIYNGQFGTRPDVVVKLVEQGLLREHRLRYNLQHTESVYEFTPAGLHEVKRIEKAQGSK